MKKNFIRTISLVLALVMSFSLMTTAFAAETDVAPDDVIGSYTDTDNSNDLVVWYDENGNIVDFETPDDAALVTSFKDVKSSAWYYKDVMECAKLGIVAGFEDGSFRPENNVTSVQFIVMLTRTFYNADVENYKTKPAAAKNAWYWPNLRAAQLYALNYDITVDETAMNRYDMARALASLLSNKNLTLSSNDKKVTNAMFSIKDWNSIPTNRQAPVSQCYAQGIITGMSDGTFSGKGNMTRAQACTVIMRMLKLVNNYNPGDKDNDQYDDGKNQNTGDTSNNQNTSTGTGKLTNGKDATVANVTAMLNDWQRQWPNGTTWDANGSKGNYYADGNKDGDVKTLKNQVGNPLGSTSLTYACGGFMRMTSDHIFGITGAPAREVTNPRDIRPGDIIAKFNQQGTLKHAAIVLSVGTPYANKTTGGTIYPITTVDGNMDSEVFWGKNVGILDGLGATNYSSIQGVYYRVYTRYPA